MKFISLILFFALLSTPLQALELRCELTFSDGGKLSQGMSPIAKIEIGETEDKMTVSSDKETQTEVIKRVKGKQLTWTIMEGFPFGENFEVRLSAIDQKIYLIEPLADGKERIAGEVPTKCENVEEVLNKLAINQVSEVKVDTPEVSQNSPIHVDETARFPADDHKLKRGRFPAIEKGSTTLDQ